MQPALKNGTHCITLIHDCCVRRLHKLSSTEQQSYISVIYDCCIRRLHKLSSTDQQSYISGLYDCCIRRLYQLSYTEPQGGVTRQLCGASAAIDGDADQQRPSRMPLNRISKY